MNTGTSSVKRALISVSNKDGIIDLAKGLSELGVEIISTGGTAKKIAEAGIPVKDIGEFTGFPEMMEGRVKTLHPLVHGGILGLRDKHAYEAIAHGINTIDLVIVNLYPFAETIKKPNVPFDEVIENIDIGGPTMIRSAAKNMGWVSVLVDPTDYSPLLTELRSGGINFETRKRLAIKAFEHTAQYDSIIHTYLNEEKLPNKINLTFNKLQDLRYGENPHQEAAVYIEPNYNGFSILTAKKIQGKELSYNNINDADGALATLHEFTDPACVVVKHANPCGVAIGEDITDVFRRAYQADAMSAFGGIIALNQPCNKSIAEEIINVYAEIVMAPSFDKDALEILAKKKNMRVLQVHESTTSRQHSSVHVELRQVEGGMLVQDLDTKVIFKEDLAFPTDKKPTDQELKDMLFGWKVLKHVKSNGILVAKNNTTLGIGPGQVSRVDAVKIALRKTTVSPPNVGGADMSGANAKRGSAAGAVLCSDAFFPFRDSIDMIAPTGITAIIQPGGSIKDQEVIDACNEHNISMIFTGARCFKH
jgi:phosphoribosylaminoimidazolecarboxamide formyltransferase / IMP cyclohydrolase